MLLGMYSYDNILYFLTFRGKTPLNTTGCFFPSTVQIALLVTFLNSQIKLTQIGFVMFVEPCILDPQELLPALSTGGSGQAVVWRCKAA